MASPFFVPRTHEWSSSLSSLRVSRFRDSEEGRLFHCVLSQSLGRCLSTSCSVFTSQTPFPHSSRAALLNGGTSLIPQTERRHANFSTSDSVGRLGESTQQRPDLSSELFRRFVPVCFVSVGLSCFLLDGNPLTTQRNIRLVRDPSGTETLQDISSSRSAEYPGPSDSVKDFALLEYVSPAASSAFLSPEKQRNGFSRDCRHVSIPFFSGRGPDRERQLVALCREAPEDPKPSRDDCEQKQNKEKLDKKEESPASPLVPFALSKEKYMQKKFSKASDYRRTSSGMRICDKEEGRGDRVVQPGDVVWLQYEGRRASDDQLFESTSCARLPTFLSNLLALFGWKTGTIAGLDGRYVRVKIRKRSDDSISTSEKQPAAGSPAEPLSHSTSNGHPLKTPDNFRGGGLSTHEPVDFPSREANNTQKPSKWGNIAESEKREEGEPADPTQVFHPIIPALEEEVQGMRVGGLRELIVPPRLAYPSICDEVLVYEVYVVWIGESLPQRDTLRARFRRASKALSGNRDSEAGD